MDLCLGVAFPPVCRISMLITLLCLAIFAQGKLIYVQVHGTNQNATFVPQRVVSALVYVDILGLVNPGLECKRE